MSRKDTHFTKLISTNPTQLVSRMIGAGANHSKHLKFKSQKVIIEVPEEEWNILTNLNIMTKEELDSLRKSRIHYIDLEFFE